MLCGSGLIVEIPTLCDGVLRFGSMADGLEWLPEDGVVLTRADLATIFEDLRVCLLYTSPSPRDRTRSRMPSSA